MYPQRWDNVSSVVDNPALDGKALTHQMHATRYTLATIANVRTALLIAGIFRHGSRLHVRHRLYVDRCGACALYGDERVECAGANVCGYVCAVRAHNAHYSTVDITCARPTQLNGHTALRVYGADDARADQLVYGTVLSFNCTLGYTLLGPDTWTCAVTCPPPPSGNGNDGIARIADTSSIRYAQPDSGVRLWRHGGVQVRTAAA
ncbi:unnamed protein product [Sphagnum balticum]